MADSFPPRAHQSPFRASLLYRLGSLHRLGLLHKLGLLCGLLAAGALARSGAAWSAAPSSGAEMTNAAQAWLAALDDQQRSTALMEYASPARLDWHFIPKASRKGLQIRDMNMGQRELARKLLKTGLSQIGYDKATKIMEVENLLKELEKNKTNTPLRDPYRYYFTLFGKPDAKERWGLSIEGHHMSFNFVIENSKVISSTPHMFGANPATMKGEELIGFKPGMRLLAGEESLAFDLLKSLTPEQRTVAIIAEKALEEVRSAGQPQPPTDAPVGLSAQKLATEQRAILQSLLAVYAGNLADDVAREKLAEIEKSGLPNVWFAWAGADRPGVGHYYRIQGPTFLIEFVNTQPDAAGNPANHIHCTWRDVRGDFAIPIGK